VVVYTNLVFLPHSTQSPVTLIQHMVSFVYFLCSSGTLQELISHTMIHWAQESFIQNPELVRMMFSLLHRQYDGLGELMRALPKAYIINAVSIHDTMDLLDCLGQIRSLLIVQMGSEEERLMIQSIGLIYSSYLFCISCLLTGMIGYVRGTTHQLHLCLFLGTS